MYYSKNYHYIIWFYTAYIKQLYHPKAFDS